MRNATLLCGRYSYRHCCSIRIRLDFERPAELADALSHSQNPDAKRLPSLGLVRWNFCYPAPVVLDAYHNLATFLRQPNQRALCAGMPVNVGEAFLNDT